MRRSKPKKKPRGEKKPPVKINNYVVNKPTVARSLNVYPKHSIKRDVEEIKPVVNGKVADEKLIHKPQSDDGQTFFPVIEKGPKNGPTKNSKSGRRNSKKKESDSHSTAG